MSGIVDAWDNFYDTRIFLFTVHARDKPLWPGLIDEILRNIVELRRLRRLLETKRGRFKFKLESVSLWICFIYHLLIGNSYIQSRVSIKRMKL